ncbi:MAG TPA: hypothetical protein VNK23_16695 [Candidatus Dormibacteraeota bacterium]|nr:hypothetical protein [Candidatus Dormibacteraeota bacterium]
MFLRCVNPRCSSNFDYRQGQLIRAPKDLRSDDVEAGGECRHFWLCGTCASQYFLEYRKGEGVIMAPQPLARVAHKATKVAAA